MKVLLGMSGGLDSTYAARVLLDAGHTVEGAVLLMHDYTETREARESAASLGIPLHEIDCRAGFDRDVVLPFCRSYLAGKTPNPCILCNERVKLHYLYAAMRELGFDRIATGHYARITEKDGRFAICRALDAKKDQSYVLYRLPQEVLAHLLTPLSDYEKTTVRALAESDGLAAADRAESMEICFLPDGNYPAYIASRFDVMGEGDFVDTSGRVLGRHRGILHYTVGQRKGLGIALGERMFVSHIDPAGNTVTLSRDAERGTSEFSVCDLVFSGLAPQSEGEGRYTVKLRYLAPPVPATVSFEGGRVRVRLDTPAPAVTPGQSAVFYEGDRVAFGGFIE